MDGSASSTGCSTRGSRRHEPPGLSVDGTAVSVSSLRIDRDIHYTSEQAGGLFPFDVPEGEYFFLGDNSNNSNDSRGWGASQSDREHRQIHTVLRERILGKASYDVLYLEFDWPWNIPWSLIHFGGVR